MSETNKKEAAFVNKNAKQVVNKQIEIEKKRKEEFLKLKNVKSKKDMEK